MEERIKCEVDMKKYILILLALLFVGVSTYYYGVSQAETKIEYKEIRLTQKQIDSLKATIKPIKQEIIVYKDRWKVLKEKETEIVYDTIICKEIVDNLKEQLENCDSIVSEQDKIITITDTIIKRQEVIIEKMVLPKKRPWGVGIQAGYGTDGKDFRPTIGVGVSYNFLRF